MKTRWQPKGAVAANRTTQQTIDGVVRTVAPPSSESTLSAQLDDLITATLTQAQVTAANTLAVGQGAAAQSSGSSGSMLGAIGSVASSFLGGGIVPLISGLIDLFGGGSSDTPPVLTRYSPPASLNFSAANGPGSSLQGVSYDQSGQPRTAGSNSGGSSQAITIQVQAMDSQSFLDHSQDIASAVRQAMLNMHPLNDVISDM